MPRVHKVKKSRKEFPGIPVGSTYYWWKFRYGGKRRSLTRPKPSQLTQSPFLSEVYSIQEEVEEFVWTWEDLEGVLARIEGIAERVREMQEEVEYSLSNIPEDLQESHMLYERNQSCEEWADAWENLEIPDLADIRIEAIESLYEEKGEEDDEFSEQAVQNWIVEQVEDWFASEADECEYSGE